MFDFLIFKESPYLLCGNFCLYALFPARPDVIYPFVWVCAGNALFAVVEPV